MMSTTETSGALWVAYGASGVTGSIRKSGEGAYTVTMAGASEPLGTYPTMDIAKRALHAHMPSGSDWPTFTEH